MGIRIWLFAAMLVLVGAINLTTGRLSASAQAQSFTISGRVSDPPSGTGVGINGVTLTLTLNSGTQMMTQTDSDGSFSFTNVAAGSNYDVVPSKPNYTFNPASLLRH